MKESEQETILYKLLLVFTFLLLKAKSQLTKCKEVSPKTTKLQYLNYNQLKITESKVGTTIWGQYDTKIAKVDPKGVHISWQDLGLLCQAFSAKVMKSCFSGTKEKKLVYNGLWLSNVPQYIKEHIIFLRY